jgi:hypothetical protein
MEAKVDLRTREAILGSLGEELARARIREGWKKLTDADVVLPRRQFIGNDPKVLTRSKVNKATISDAYVSSGKALVSLSFVGIGESCPLAFTLFLGGREKAIRGD